MNAQLEALVKELGEERTHALRAYLVQFLNYAHRYDELSERLSHKIIPLRGYGVRYRLMCLEEIGLFWIACDKLESVYADFFRLALLTGARRREIIEASPEEFDLRRGIWKLPEHRTKSRRPIDIPLCPLAERILRRRLKTEPRRYMLEGAGGSKLQSDTYQRAKLLSEMRKLKPAATNGSGNDPTALIRPFTTHDLRRTLATNWGEHLNVPSHIIEEQLNHAPTARRPYPFNVFLKDRVDAARRWGGLISLCAHHARTLHVKPKISRAKDALIAKNFFSSDPLYFRMDIK